MFHLMFSLILNISSYVEKTAYSRSVPVSDNNSETVQNPLINQISNDQKKTTMNTKIIKELHSLFYLV